MQPACSVEQILPKLPSLTSQARSVSEMAESLATVVVDAVAKTLSPPPRRTPELGCCESEETVSTFKVAWDAGEDARRSVRHCEGHNRVKDADDDMQEPAVVVKDPMPTSNSTLLKQKDFSLTTTNRASASTGRARLGWAVERGGAKSSSWTRMGRR